MGAIKTSEYKSITNGNMCTYMKI